MGTSGVGHLDPELRERAGAQVFVDLVCPCGCEGRVRDLCVPKGLPDGKVASSNSCGGQVRGCLWGGHRARYLVALSFSPSRDPRLGTMTTVLQKVKLKLRDLKSFSQGCRPGFEPKTL